MSVPRDSMRLIPAIASDKDLDAFRDKYGEATSYHFECGIAEDVIRVLATQFPNITFFGYISYNNSCSFAEYYYQNIIFNGKGVTYLGKMLHESVGMDEVDITDLKVYEHMGDTHSSEPEGKKDEEETAQYYEDCAHGDDELPY